MMKKMKYLTVTAILSCAMLLTVGCQKKAANPADTVEAFYQLLVAHNEKPITKLGIDKKEASKTLKTYETATIASLKKDFKSAGINVTDDDMEKIYQSYSTKLAALKYKITVNKKEEKSVSVTVQSQYIDYLKIFSNAKKTTLAQLKPNLIEKQSDAKQLLIQNIVKGFQETSAAADMHSKTFILKKQDVKSGDHTVTLYYPEESASFGSDIMKLVTNQS